MSTDDASEMVLSAGPNGTMFAWELEYGQARQRALECLRSGRKQEALEAARMQFVLCPFEPVSLDAAVKSVQQVLVTVDGDDARAKQFEAFARFGPFGSDGVSGTPDDMQDPLKAISPTGAGRGEASYAEFDDRMYRYAATGQEWEKGWCETEKAFARLNGGDFDAAAEILAVTLAGQAKLPRSRGDDWELSSAQDNVDRIAAGLSVVYRARTGTTAGAAEFVRQCIDYATYGPAGVDGAMGTPDDLTAPM